MRRWLVLTSLLALIAGACSDSATPATTAAAPTTTAPAASTTSAMTAPQTTPASTTTEAPELWPLASDVAADLGVTFDFTVADEDHPALPLGEGWDGVFTYSPYVLHHDGTFHMFYTGWSTEVAIGYATSTDGHTFTRVGDEPILELKRTVGGRTVFPHRPLVHVTDDGTWVMYFSNNVSKRFNGRELNRATAPAPDGPWTVDQDPIFVSTGDWDREVVGQDLVAIGDRVVLFYDGIAGDTAIGALLSNDGGVTFSAMDDPATEAPTDPVLGPWNEQAWDGLAVGSPVAFVTTDGAFEMFFIGFEGPENLSGVRVVKLGYALGDLEGPWQRHAGNPVIELSTQSGAPGSLGYPWMGGVLVDGTYYLYYAIDAGGRGIGVVTGTIARD